MNKRWIKVTFIILMSILLVFSMIGCSSKRTEQASSNEGGNNQKIVIKFSHVVAENTPKGQAAIMFANKVKEKTNGRVEVQVFPNSQLYKDEDVLNAIQQGNVQMAAPATSVITKLYPQWQVFDLPFAFADHEQVQQAMEGEIGKKLFSLLEEKNIKGLAMWDNGFKQMGSNKKELIKPEDFAGQKFRVMSSKVLEEQFKAVGANPVPMPFGEVYNALEQGVIDGQENTLSNIYSQKMHEVQKYLTLSYHGYLGYAVITNKKFWDSLPADVRSQIEAALDETTQWVRQNAKDINEQMLQKIKAENPKIKIHELTPEEKKLWIAKMDPIYDKFKNEIGEDLINAVRALRK
ncbi:TRAP transporter substrate-binding protein [Tepidibacillus sp. LV47]|uniref:TRAP transporter substrate-binding protein n=1 Tax=Tepidibacillus sp. LV47 TaxID=3398228 RepID=UPI003AAED6DE